ncbi:MAG: PIN domain-containing protein [Acetobacteraceae bacterium]|nr:PIN domain-containing protein [Acetobacteraceae bacterium]
MPGRFFDTNVLIYLVSSDAGKANRAETLLTEGGTISVQVLNEIANVARRKMRLSWEETHALLTSVRGFLVVRPLTLEIHETGLEISQRHGLSTYDAMIVASALDAGCDTLWSEDMHHGMVFEGRLRIVNPFRGPTP